MKKLQIPLLILAAFGAFFFTKDSAFSLVGKVVSIALLMYIIMQLMSKVPSKNNQEENQNNNEDDIS